MPSTYETIRHATPEQAFERAALDLAMEKIRIDSERVPALVGYRDGTMSYLEAREAMRNSSRG